MQICGQTYRDKCEKMLKMKMNVCLFTYIIYNRGKIAQN